MLDAARVASCRYLRPQPKQCLQVFSGLRALNRNTGMLASGLGVATKPRAARTNLVTWFVAVYGDIITLSALPGSKTCESVYMYDVFTSKTPFYARMLRSLSHC